MRESSVYMHVMPSLACRGFLFYLQVMMPQLQRAVETLGHENAQLAEQVGAPIMFM